ncbi:MAG TPA: DUF2314 domain-containing protein [Bacillota bacterium]|nr:DUF2314 domain-containing protein [Bacillota bacterium]
MEKEPVVWFEGEDQEMLEAIHLAQSNFSQFLDAIEEESRRIVPVFEDALVKYAFPATKNKVKVEHMFLSNIQFNGNCLSGVVVSEPMYTDAVKAGQTVEIEPSRVSDWLYVIDGAGTGGYTFKVMYSRFSEREKKMYGNEPPFVWIKK